MNNNIVTLVSETVNTVVGPAKLCLFFMPKFKVWRVSAASEAGFVLAFWDYTDEADAVFGVTKMRERITNATSFPIFSFLSNGF